MVITGVEAGVVAWLKSKAPEFFLRWLRRLVPKPDRFSALVLTAWSFFVMFALLVAIFGTLILALLAPRSDTPPATPEKQQVVVVNVGGDDQESERPPEVPAPTTNLVLLLDVDVSPPAPAPPPPVAREVLTQSVELAVNAAGVASSDPVRVDDGGRNDLVVVLDRQKIVKKTERTAPVVKPPQGNPLGRVEFKPRSRRVRASQRREVRRIAHDLRKRTGFVLVAGYSDDCGWSRLAERRAKSVGKALRRELRCCSRWRPRWRNRGMEVHTQAAASLPGTAAGNCEKDDHGTATVYLLERLK